MNWPTPRVSSHVTLYPWKKEPASRQKEREAKAVTFLLERVIGRIL